jgi:hypothetical protein
MTPQEAPRSDTDARPIPRSCRRGRGALGIAHGSPAWRCSRSLLCARMRSRLRTLYRRMLRVTRGGDTAPILAVCAPIAGQAGARIPADASLAPPPTTHDTRCDMARPEKGGRMPILYQGWAIHRSSLQLASGEWDIMVTLTQTGGAGACPRVVTSPHTYPTRAAAFGAGARLGQREIDRRAAAEDTSASRVLQGRRHPAVRVGPRRSTRGVF